jgi:hypothetical protein
VPKAVCSASLEFVEVNPFTKAVIKINEILSAATVTTGAKITPMILVISKYFPIFSSNFRLKTDWITINGEATI